MSRYESITMNDSVKNQYIPEVQLLKGDCLQTLKDLPDASIDSVVCDPPYHLTSSTKSKGFMGKTWDGGDIAFRTEIWTECLRVLKPGGHLIAFGATRTIHRITCAVEDAGFEIRDMFSWLYYTSMPKGLNVSRAIDGVLLNGSSHTTSMRKVELEHGDGSYEVSYRNNGYMGEKKQHERKHLEPQTEEAKQWVGWGTGLKTAYEPSVLARKPVEKNTVAEQVLETGTGALNIDACRHMPDDNTWPGPQEGPCGWGGNVGFQNTHGDFAATDRPPQQHHNGRWPANIYHCPKPSRKEKDAGLSHLQLKTVTSVMNVNNGSGEQFDGCATPQYRNSHPTVKPVQLFRHLIRLVTPPGGTVLDPFAGSGTTGVAATLEGFDSVLCELTEEYWPIIEGRVEWAREELLRDNQQLRLF